MSDLDISLAAREAVRELPPVATVRQCAEFLGVTDRTFRRWAAQGRVKALRIHQGPGTSRVMVTRAEMARLLTASALPAAVEAE